MSGPSWKSKAEELSGEVDRLDAALAAAIRERDAAREDASAAASTRVTAIAYAEAAIARVVVLEEHLASGPMPGPAPAWDEPTLAPIVAATREINAAARAAAEAALPDTATGEDLERHFDALAAGVTPAQRARLRAHADRLAEDRARRAELAANTEQPTAPDDGAPLGATRGAR